MKVVAVFLGMVGMFLVGCAILPPPFFEPISPFQRIVAGLVGVTAMLSAVNIYRDAD